MAEHQYLTAEGLKKIQKEIEVLKERKREIAEKLKEAISLGDLSENADYHKLKDDQAINESRLRELEEILRTSEIIKNKRTGKIEVGSTFEVVDELGKRIKFKILGQKESNPLSGIISNESPLGSAFLGKKVNETLVFKAPNGRVKQYKIIKIL